MINSGEQLSLVDPEQAQLPERKAVPFDEMEEKRKQLAKERLGAEVSYLPNIGYVAIALSAKNESDLPPAA